MAEEQLAFARKASGLVRGLSMWDAFGVGLMNQGLTPSIWVMLSLGLGVYLGGNLLIATVISVALVGFAFPIVWGVLGGSMPRSGGEYIYNSRIIHPIIGIGESFGNAVVYIMWIYVLAPWIADPGMVWLASFMDWPALADFATAPWGMFLIATVANAIGFSFVVFGVKVFAKAQKVVMALAVGGVVALCIGLSLYDQQDFISAWNTTAAQYGSLDYDAFLSAVNEAAGTVMPTTWNWHDTFGVMVAGSWLFMYSYMITYIAGEVKRPDKTIMFANLIAILVPAAFMIWTAAALYRMVPFDFLSATQWVDLNGSDLIEGYNLPWSTSYIGLLAIVNANKVLLFFGTLSFLLFSLWWCALDYLAFPRIIFAWGMDRMGPKWFTDINPRWASPVKNHVLCFVLGEIGIALYVFWTNNPIAGLAVTALEIFSVFGITAIAALVFPYRKRARGIWESSPYRNWKVLGVPLVSIGAFVMLVYLGILAYFFFFAPVNLEGFTLNAGLVIIVTWVLGLSWYFFWSWRARSSGTDVSMTYGELPPE